MRGYESITGFTDRSRSPLRGSPSGRQALFRDVFLLALLVTSAAIFLTAGAGGYLVETPSHLVLVNGTVATIKCSSNKSFPTWKQDDWSRDNTTEAIEKDCTVQGPQRFTCDLTILPTALLYFSGGLTARHTCADITDTGGTDYSFAQAVLVYLDKIFNRIIILI